MYIIYSDCMLWSRKSAIIIKPSTRHSIKLVNIMFDIDIDIGHVQHEEKSEKFEKLIQ